MEEKRKEDRKHKSKKKKEKKKKQQKEKRRSTSSSSSGSESDEWVEQQKEIATKPRHDPQSSSRDDWMSMTGMIATYTKDDIRTDKKEKEKKHIDSYNPATSTRELNPYWKDGGSGLPTSSAELKAKKPFKRPGNDDDLYDRPNRSKIPDKDNYYKADKSKSFHRADDDDALSNSNFKSSSKDDEHRSNRSRDFKRPNASNDYYRSSERSKDFRKPNYDDDFYGKSEKNPRSSNDDSYRSRDRDSSSWRKRTENNYSESRTERIQETTRPIDTEVVEIKETKPDKTEETKDDKFLSDEKMNKLAAKIVKAEIMGDTDLVNKLKSKLEEARTYRKENPNAGKSADIPEDIMLMSTSSRGDSRPLTKSAQAGDPRSKGGKRKAETHMAGERMKYFSNDDGQSLSEMFEQEKYGSNYDEEAQLAKIATKHTNPNDDLEDIFTEEISKHVDRAKEDERNKQRAIKQHAKLEKSLDGCDYCVGSKTMMKHLMVSCGSKVYLALPARKSLTRGHCVITTVQHATCVTALDEDVWEEVMNFRKALVNFFNSQDEDVVFFETAVRMHKYPHLVINCVPMPRDVGDTAPIYFKKALLECEAEWSMNKKVVDLKGKNIRKGIPKGLPYFWVDFGMDAGFAHIIEDQQLFPNNFAEEIIGGILDLDHQLWKKPQRENGDQLRRKVSEFVQLWKKFDTVSKSKV